MEDLQSKMQEFWTCFDKADFVSKARCAELAGEIIPELESAGNDAVGILRTLVIALGCEELPQSEPVMFAMRRARQFLRAEAVS